MKQKHFLLLLLLSLVLCFALIPIGAYSHQWKLLAATFLYLGATLLALRPTKSSRDRWIVAALMAAPPLAVYLPLHLRDYESTQLGLPSFAAHLAGIAFAFGVQASRGRWKYAIPIALLVLTPLAAFKGYALWLHNVSFGTYTGNTSYTVPVPVEGMLQDGQSFSAGELKGKVVVLDFWHTRCGVCFQKFPQVQKLYDQYKADPSVVLLAINKPLEGDSTGQAFAMLKQRHYSFPVLMPHTKTLPEAFGVRVYPTTVVMDTAGVVVYRGSIEKAATVIERLMAR